METNPLKQPGATKSAAGVRPATRKQVHTRARELALIAGRAAPHVAQADYVQAKRELTGESDTERQDAILDALPESKRWDPVPGSAGHQAPESPSEDEDDEGRNESAQLVDEGNNAAANDQMRHTTRPARPASKDKPT